jgi:hypothetical protein
MSPFSPPVTHLTLLPKSKNQSVFIANEKVKQKEKEIARAGIEPASLTAVGEASNTRLLPQCA